MRQVKIISVGTASMTTSDGSVVYPCGNKIFNPGDYAWVSGSVAFGHVPAGGSTILLQSEAKIPIVSWKSNSFAFGYIEGGKYTEAFSMESDENSYGIFVNNASKAYYLRFSQFHYIGSLGSGHDVISGTQYNLLTGEKLSEIGGVVLDAEIDDDGNLLFAAWNNNYTAMYTNLSHSVMVITDADFKIYKNGEIFTDCMTVFRALAATVEAKLKELTGEKFLYIFTDSIMIKCCSLHKDGSCSIYVWMDVESRSAEEDGNKRLQGNININISSGGAYTFDFCPNWSANRDAAFTEKTSFEVNGFTVESQRHDESETTGEYDISDSDNKKIAAIQKSSTKTKFGCYEWTISAVAGLKEAVYISCYGVTMMLNEFDYAFCDLYKSTEAGTAVLIEGRYINNTRFAKMLNINTIKANLQKIWKGQDADE